MKTPTELWAEGQTGEAFEAALKEADQLRARVAELEKDKARLDWLESAGVGMDYIQGEPAIGHESAYGPEPGHPSVWSLYRTRKPGDTYFLSRPKDSIRAAIDTAKENTK